MTTTGPIDLSNHPIHLGTIGDEATSAVLLEDFTFDGPGFEAYIARHCSTDAPGRLVMVETTPQDWATWERHPLGDEIVIVLEGAGTFVHQIDGAETRIEVTPGATVINPRGVWHTADVSVPIKAVYITPCPETDHKPRD